MNKKVKAIARHSMHCNCNKTVHDMKRIRHFERKYNNDHIQTAQTSVPGYEMANMTTTEGNTGTISDTTPKKQSPDIAQNPPTAHISTENTIPSGSGSDTIELGASTSGDSNVCSKQHFSVKI